MEQQHLRAVVEALLLATESPIPMHRIQAALGDVNAELINDALSNLVLEYSGPARGIHLVQIAGGYQFRTNPAFGDAIRALFETKPARLSRAAMETLAIIAYRQPITRAEIEDVRGVNCSQVLKTLEEHHLIAVIGQLDDIGKPNIYGTTDRFLAFFGLAGIHELPTLESSELQALIEMHDEAQAVFDAEEKSTDSTD